MAVAFTVLLCHKTYQHYIGSPTVISIESNYREWNISVVSLFVCPEEKVYGEFLNAVSYRVASEFDADVHIVSSFLTALANLTYYNFDTMKNFTGKINIPPEQYLELVKAVSFKFSYQVSNAKDLGFDAKQERIIPIYTEFGLCYAHNSQIAKSLDRNISVAGGDTDELEIDPPLVGSYLLPGTPRGLFEINSPYQAYFLSAWDIPTMGSLLLSKKCPYMYRLNADLLGNPLYATQTVRDLNVNRRKCRFYDESNLKISPLYSVNLCRSQCRIDLAVKKCGCAPFFYERLVQAGYKICDVEGMLCLVDIADALILILGKKAKSMYLCDCYPTCESDTYKFYTEPDVNQWQLAIGGTSLGWKMSNFPEVRSKRDVIFTFSDLLVAFGGTAGLFLGFSVLSMVELVYYISLRPFFYVRDIKRNRGESKLKHRSISF